MTMLEPTAPPQPPARARARFLAGCEAYPVAVTLAVAAVLHVGWLLLLANTGGDIAAQDAWAEFAKAHPDSAYDLAWYGGMHPVSYSIISPYIMALLGVRPTMMLAGTLGAGLLALLLVRRGGIRHPLVPALVGAAAMVGNAVSGRVTFALGTCFGLAALAVVYAWPERWRRRRLPRGVLVALLATLATGSSPVAGLFLGIVAGGLWLGRRRGAAYALGIPPVLVVGLSSWLFPFGGRMPITWPSVLLPVLTGAVIWASAPRSWKPLRYGALLYVAFTLFAWLVPSPIGTNVTRLGLVFGGVLVAAIWLSGHARSPWPRVAPAQLLALSLFCSVGWQIGTATRDEIVTAPSAAWAHSTHAIIDELRARGAATARVEVVPSGSHREASALAPYVNLARGWNRQADTDRNPLFYTRRPLSAAAYRGWLHRWAVRFVVVPPGSPDLAAARERRLVLSGVGYLRPVWSDRYWRLFQVTDAAPVVTPPARLTAFEASGLTVHVPRPATVAVRVPWSPWLSLVDAHGHLVKVPDDARATPDGCLARRVDPDQEHDVWVTLRAPRAGVYRISTDYRIGDGSACPR